MAAGGGTRFAAPAGLLACFAATATRRAGCRFDPQPRADTGVLSSTWWLPLGDIGEKRFTGRAEASGDPLRLAGLRVVPGAASEPVEGIWWDPLQPGTGFALSRRSDVLALSLFDYDAEGRSRWRNAAGAWHEGVLDTEALGFRGGGCFGCALPQPQPVAAAASAVRFQAGGARSARLEVAPHAAVDVASMPYGMRYLDADPASPATPLPDLAGTWLLSAPGAGVSADVLVLAEGQVDGEAIAFDGTTGRDARPATLRCGLRERFPGCVLELADGATIEFPLDRMGEDRLGGSVAGELPEALLVRVPAAE